MAAAGVWDERAWLARVRDGSGVWIVGTGFAVDASNVLTAAHVVVDAGAGGPGDRVWVDFPMLDGAGCWAVVMDEGWAPEDGTRGDTALLHLEAPPPGLVPVPVRAVKGLRGQAFIAYGFPEHYDDGVEATGHAGGPVGLEWVQLEVEAGLGVQPGFSGGPVWSQDLHAVVGLLTNRDEGAQGRVAFAVPVRVVAGRSEVVAAALPTALELDPARESHWVPRSRGTAGVVVGGRWLFQGRRRALRDLTAWLVSDDGPAMRVVTGTPGCGKSAVLGRIVTSADRRYRHQIPDLDEEDPGVPPAGAIGVTIHARDRFVTDVVAHIAGLMDLDGIEVPDQLLTAIGDLPGVRIVIDAVDEAKQPVELARFLTDLSRAGARVLVGTREHLLALLDDPDPMRLDRGPFMDHSDVHAYVAELLASDVQGANGTRPWPADTPAEEVAAEITEAAEGNFLVAQLATQSIRFSGLVTRPFPGHVHEAFDRLLDALPDPHRVRDLLLPLAYALGDGLLAGELWLSGCAALSRPYHLADIHDLLASPAMSFLTTATSDGHTRQYRLFHQALNEALTRDRETDHDARRIWTAWQPAGTGANRWANAPEYLRVHGAEHAAAAGQLPELISDPDFLICADLIRLLPLLPVGSPAGDSPAGAVVHRAATRAAPLPAPRRARLLALTAAHLGFPNLHQSLASICEPPTPLWAHTLGDVHQELTGHTGTVTAVAIGRLDGREVIVSGSSDRTVRIWDSAGAPVGAPLRGHTDWVRAVAIGKLDGRDVIVSGSIDQTVRIWDDAGRPVGDPLRGPTGSVNAVAIGRLDGRDVIVSGSNDHAVRIWDSSGQPAGAPQPAHTGPVNTVTVGKLNGRDVIVSGSDDTEVRIWDSSGKPAGDPLRGHPSPVNAVAVGRLDGRDVIVSGGTYDQTVRIWDSSGQPAGKPLHGHTDSVNAVTVGQLNGREVIVSGSDDQTVRIWGRAGSPTGEPLHAHTDTVNALAVGQLDGRRVIVSVSGDTEVRIWADEGLPVGDLLSGHTNTVTAVALGRLDGRNVIVTGSADRTVRIWNGAGLPVGDPLRGHTGSVNAVAIGQLDGREVIVSSSDDTEVRIWDSAGQPTGPPLRGHTHPVNTVAIGKLDGRDVIVSGGGTYDHTIRIWDSAGRQVAPPLRGHDASVYGVAIGQLDGRDVIVSGSRDQKVRIWDSAGRQVGRPLTGHTDLVRAVALGRFDGRDVIVTGSWDQTVRIWDSAGRPLAQIDLLAPCTSLCMTTDHIYVATGRAISAFTSG